MDLLPSFVGSEQRISPISQYPPCHPSSRSWAVSSGQALLPRGMGSLVVPDWSCHLCRLCVSLFSRPPCSRGQQVSMDFGLGGGFCHPFLSTGLVAAHPLLKRSLEPRRTAWWIRAPFNSSRSPSSPGHAPEGLSFYMSCWEIYCGVEERMPGLPGCPCL